MKLVRKTLAVILASALLCTIPGMNALAGDIGGEQSSIQTGEDMIVQTGESETAVDNSNEVQNDIKEESSSKDEETQTDLEEGKKETALEYVYIESDVVNIPDTQNIVVALKDTEKDIESAVLVYQSDITGTQYEISGTTYSDNTVCFTKEFSQGPIEDSYSLASIQYKTTDSSDILTEVFSEVDINANFTVTTNAKTIDQSGSGISVTAMDENGSMVEQNGNSDEIVDVVEEVTEIVDSTAVGSDAEVATMSEDNDSAATYATPRANNLVVAINAGHDTGSSHNSGASGYGLKEDILTWYVAQACIAELKRYPGVTVLDMRPNLYGCPVGASNTSDCVKSRVQVAASRGANLYIDLHFNAGGGAGAEVYYPNGSGIDWNIANTGGNVATNILSQLAALGLTPRGVFGDDEYWTITTSAKFGFPGLIVEHAFVDNANDASKLMNQSFLTQLGIADATGIAQAYGLKLWGIGTTEIENADYINGTFDVVMSDINLPASISGVSIAVNNGSTPEQWYEAKRQSDGTYKATVNIEERHNGYEGDYTVLGYVRDVNGNLYSGGNVTFNMVYKPTIEKTEITNYDSTMGTFDVILTGVKAKYGVGTTCISVSKDSGNTTWKTAYGQSDGSYKASVDIAEFGYASGNYSIIGYARDSRGVLGVSEELSKAISLTAPTVKLTEIKNYNSKEASFNAIVTIGSSEKAVSGVSFAVTAPNGTTLWRQAEKQDDGTYSAKIVASDFGNVYGEYSIVAYVRGINAALGVGDCVKQIVKEPAVPSIGSTTIENYNKRAGTFDVIVKNVEAEAGINGVSIAVWNSQGTTIWHGAEKQSDGSYKSTVGIENYGGTTGIYNAQAYVRDNAGRLGVGETVTQKVEEPAVPSIGSTTIENYNKSAGTFDVIAKNVEAEAGVNGVSIAVWNSQGTTIWHGAEKQSDGSYKSTVGIENYGGTIGIYNAQAYVRDNAGRLGVGETVTQKVEEPAVPSIGSTAIENYNKGAGTFDVIVKNVEAEAGVNGVSIAVWNSQGTTIWHEAQKQSDGSYKSTVGIENYGGITGIYTAQAYVRDKAGRLGVGETKIQKVEEPAIPSIGNTTIENYNRGAGTFDVIVKDIEAEAGVSGVSIAVWNSQGTTIWHEAQKQSDGSYKSTVGIENYGGATGIYSAQAYVRDKAGRLGVGETKNQKVEEPSIPSIGSTTIENYNKGAGTFDVIVKNIEAEAGVSGVSIAVWNSQGTTIWHEAQKQSDGSYKLTVGIENYGGATGIYSAQAYVRDKAGRLGVGETKTQQVEEPSVPSIGSTVIENYNKKAGTFDIIVKDIDAEAGISAISIAVSSSRGTTIWHEAKKQSDGSYKVTISSDSYGGAKGTYTIQAYVRDQAGRLGVGDVLTQKLEESSIPKIGSTIIDNYDKSTGTFDVIVQNIETDFNISSVSILVYNEAGITIWHSATMQADGSYKASISIDSYNGAQGVYTVQAYVRDEEDQLVEGKEKKLRVTAPEVSSIGYTEIENFNFEAGTFDVEVRSVDAKEGVNVVSVAVWKDGSGSVWHEAEKQPDGSYKTSYNMIEFGKGVGTYYAQAYARDSKGVLFAGDITSIFYGHEIMGTSQTNVLQMVRYWNSKNVIYPSVELSVGGAPDINTFCLYVYQEAQAEGVNAEVVFAQAMLETNWLRFGNQVNIGQFNYAGIGATDGGPQGESFPDVRSGIRAQVQHLKAYASTEKLNQPQIDPRYHLVKKGCAPYVEWLGQKENPNGYGWATSKDYGYHIATSMVQLLDQ